MRKYLSKFKILDINKKKEYMIYYFQNLTIFIIYIIFQYRMNIALQDLPYKKKKEKNMESKYKCIINRKVMSTDFHTQTIKLKIHF